MSNETVFSKLLRSIDNFTNRIFVIGMHFTGITMYGTLFIKDKHLINSKLINQSNLSTLSTHFATTSTNILWHLKLMFFESSIMIPVIIYYKINHVSSWFSYIYCLMGLLVNHICGIIGNTRINMKLIEKQITINAEKKEILTSSEGECDLISQQYIDRVVIKEITTWHLSQCKTNGDTTTYVISNCYYSDLIFVFDKRDVATEFLDEVQCLKADELRLLSEDTAKASLYRLRIMDRIALKKLGSYEH